MMKGLYTIADTLIVVRLEKELENVWHRFQLHKDRKNAEICLKWLSPIADVYSIQKLSPINCGNIFKHKDGILFVNKDWTDASLYSGDSESVNVLLLLQVYSYLVTRRTLLMHSSLIDYQGNGIMFLGPSGIGKTTQAELWNQFAGADILNGDMVFVRENLDGFYGYGSPWHGSSPYCMNAKVKLKALVTLEQASENSLRRLSGFDVLQGTMDQVFLPHWYPKGMTPCLDTLNDLLAQIPVYHLACRPDEDAVQLLKNELQI